MRETSEGGRWAADYAFELPAEGIWLMAGPYQVAQQTATLDGGTVVTVRTWFHPELAELAPGYLQDSARYLQRYSRAIGAYPFGDFSIVSSPLPHGPGIPSLTYLGREVLRLPFIRATSAYACATVRRGSISRPAATARTQPCSAHCRITGARAGWCSRTAA